MKAVLVEQPGSSEQLKVVEREIPKIKEGWSLVKIKGFGIVLKFLRVRVTRRLLFFQGF